MRQYPSDIAFTPAVKGIQAAKGTRDGYAKVKSRGGRTPALARAPGRGSRLGGLRGGGRTRRDHGTGRRQ